MKVSVDFFFFGFNALMKKSPNERASPVIYGKQDALQALWSSDLSSVCWWFGLYIKSL